VASRNCAVPAAQLAQLDRGPPPGTTCHAVRAVVDRTGDAPAALPARARAGGLWRFNRARVPVLRGWAASALARYVN